MMEMVLRKCFARYFRYDWAFGLALILLFGIPRFAIVLHSYVARSYGTTMFVFLTMWFVPFVVLTRQGRRQIGLVRPACLWRLLPALLFGALSCAVLFLLFGLLFSDSISNPFAYIAGNNPGASVSGPEKSVYFWVAVIPSMLFSPIGEEFLYRGVVHGSFVPRFGETTASVFDSTAFALTHLAHFGIVYAAGVWRFLPVPALLWVLSMFAVSRLFFRCKQYAGSLWGAVFAHAGFNAMMMYLIFYWL